LFKKVNEGEEANAVYSFKIEELTFQLNKAREEQNMNNEDDKLLKAKVEDLEKELLGKKNLSVSQSEVEYY